MQAANEKVGFYRQAKMMIGNEGVRCDYLVMICLQGIHGNIFDDSIDYSDSDVSK